MIATVFTNTNKSGGGYRRSPIITRSLFIEIAKSGWEDFPLAIMDPRLLGCIGRWAYKMHDGPEWY